MDENPNGGRRQSPCCRPVHAAGESGVKREANHGSRGASASQGGTPVAPRARGCACVDDERRSLCSLVATMGLHAAACSTKISHGGVRRVAPQQPRRVGPPPPTPQAQKKTPKISNPTRPNCNGKLQSTDNSQDLPQTVFEMYSSAQRQLPIQPVRF